MPSPVHKPRSAVTSPGSIDSKGAAIRRGDLKISEPIQLPHDSNHGLSQQYATETPSNATTTSNPPLEGAWPRKSVSPGFHSRTRSNGANEPQKPRGALSKATSRGSAGPSMLNCYSPSGPSKTSPSKQKVGGFKAKICRIFGSRRLREPTFSNDSRGHQSQNVPHNFPSAEGSKNEQLGQSYSHPASDLTRSSALGAHSPKPPGRLDISSQDVVTSPKTEDLVSHHRRRNTLPSVTMSVHEGQMLAEALGDVGMRPSSKPPLHHSDGELMRNVKRRSRSADELRDGIRSHPMSPIQWRRRSGEIQYWRNSVLENPIPEPSRTRHDAYPLEPERSPVRSFAPSPSSARRLDSRDSLKQFQFGSFTNAADHSATTEQRLTTLEVKFIDHEYAIAELQGCNIKKPATATKVPKRRSFQDIFPETRDSSPVRIFLSSPADSPTPADDHGHSTQHHRSSNAPTLRPLTDISPSSNVITTEQYEALMALLAAEQAARRALEETVTELQAQVDELRNASYLSCRPSAYPTPSPESRHSPSTMRGQPPRRPLGFPHSRVGSDETSRFSVTDADESDAEAGFLDTFETPRESQESRFGYDRDRGPLTTAVI